MDEEQNTELQLKEILESWSSRGKDAISKLPNNELWQKKIYPAFESLVHIIWERSWNGACHFTSAALYIVLKELGVDVTLHIGEVRAKEGVLDHSWLEFDGLVIDAAVSLPLDEGKYVAGPILASIDLDDGESSTLEYNVFRFGLGSPAKEIAGWDLNEYVKNSGVNIWSHAVLIAETIDIVLAEESLAKKYGSSRRTYKKADYGIVGI